MTKRKKSEAFDIKLTDEQRTELADTLCRDIEDSISARQSVIGAGGTIELCDWFYEQGRTSQRDLPFPGSADLTSYLITQDVDAMRSRVIDAVYSVSPLCTVDVWGDGNAGKAPFIEEFHEWQARKEGLKEQLGIYVHQSLIEDCAILEVRERVETRRMVEQVDAAIEVGEDGAVRLNEEGKPILVRDEDGELVPAQPGAPSAKVEMDRTKTKRLGPEFDVISMKDFGFLPAHAKNQRGVWGYYKRFWERWPTILEKVEDNIYDKAAVERLGDQGEREEAPAPRTVDSVAPQYGAAAEKELFELSLKRDLDKDGREEWYIVTLSLKSREILRLKLDKFVMKVGRPRCVPFIPYPRRDSVYGYSYAGDKLLTIAEEHTALRNSTADRNALAVNAPIKVMQGAAWDPDVEPFGIGRVIHVRDMNEVEPMIVADVPQSSIFLGRDILQVNERVSGLSDVGVIGSGDRQSNTLGQDQMVAGASNIRVEEVLGHFRQSLAHIMELRHAIWIETLEEESKGIEAPSNVMQSLERRGVELESGRFTADKLKAQVWFNAYGSTDTADNNKRIQYLNKGLEALANLANFIPAIQIAFQDPEVAVSVLDEILLVYKFRNRGPWVRALRAGLQQMALPPPGGMSPAGPMQGGPPPQGGPGGPPAQGGPPAPGGGPAPGGPPDIAQMMAMLKGQGGPVVN